MTWKRRSVVAGVVVALTGCLGRFQDDTVESSAEESLQSIQNGELDSDSIHSDSPISAEAISNESSVNIDPDSMMIIEEGESEAVISVNATSGNTSGKLHIEYRKENGEWKLYEIRPTNPQSSTQPSGPPQESNSSQNASEFQ